MTTVFEEISNIPDSRIPFQNFFLYNASSNSSSSTNEIVISVECTLFSLLSFFGSLFIIVKFLCKKCGSRKIIDRMIFGLGLSDCILAISILVGQFPYLVIPKGFSNESFHPVFCLLSGMFVVFGQLCQMTWSLLFGINIFLKLGLPIIMRSNFLKSSSIFRLCQIPEKAFIYLEFFYWTIGFGIPIFVCIILAFFRNHIGSAVMGCWFKPKSGFQFIFFYIPLVLSFLVILLLYVIMIVTILRRSFSIKVGEIQGIQKLEEAFKKELFVAFRLTLFLLSFLVLWTPALLGTILLFIGEVTYHSELRNLLVMLITNIFVLQGFFDAVVYSLNTDSMEKFYKGLKCCCCWCKRKKVDEVEDKQVVEGIQDDEESFKETLPLLHSSSSDNTSIKQ